jgi:hypothetical protein
MIAELAANSSECNRVEVAMQRSMQSENIVRWYRKLIAVAEDDPARDEVRYQILMQLLAEEKQTNRTH